MNDTFRLIDDITTVNSDKVFENHVNEIYPKYLVLNKENEADDRAHVLDLQISIVNGKFDISLYDKRDDFPFKIVQFVALESNISRNTAYGVFGSQLVRYFRICNIFDRFGERIKKLVDVLIELNYSRKYLKSRFIRISEKYGFNCKFNKTERLKILFNEPC